jgi:osmoprotectant transport system substrate-binding protein
MTRRFGRWVAVASVLIAAACGSDAATLTEPEAPDGLRVANFDFAESALLGEIYAQVIESTGVPVVRLGPVGPREIIAPALEVGRIDLVPEYLGTALQYAGVTESNPDTGSARDELNGRLESSGLVALEPSPAQNKNVFVVTTETADANRLENISDLSGLGGGMRFGGLPECQERALCFGGLKVIYGLQFSEFVSHESLAFIAEALKRSEIDVGLMFSTATELDDDNLVALVDDRGMQPAENIVPVMRIEARERWGPDAIAAVDLASVRLTTDELRKLNRLVANGTGIEDVARDWLIENDLLDQS